jgi:DNA-directed RNA polymerase subunit H (RpoH/RPB5)
MEADIQLIVRSRPTIVEILENRGYDTKDYKDIHPEEVEKVAITKTDLLRIIVPKKPDSLAGAERCIVLYWTSQPVRLRIENEINKLFDKDNTQSYNSQTDEIIIILSEPYHEVFDITAVKLWTTEKIRINFFHLKNILSNPALHTMVPPHRKLSKEEVSTIEKACHASKSQFPHIKYHRDIQTRVLGLVPGDVVEITRPSETCGIATIYRICVP